MVDLSMSETVSSGSENPANTKLSSKRRDRLLYELLADGLAAKIAAGTFVASTLLPSEKWMTTTYGVSRQTVRQALGLLKKRGLVASRPGIGWIVLPTPPHVELFRPITNSKNLQDFMDETELHAVSQSIIHVSERLSDIIECRHGTQLSEALFLRTRRSIGVPLGALRIYTPPQFSAAQVAGTTSGGKIFKNLERMFGFRVAEVRQDVMATTLDMYTAELLKATPGDPALQVVRFYEAPTGQPIQVTVSQYPSSRFRQSIRYKI